MNISTILGLAFITISLAACGGGGGGGGGTPPAPNSESFTVSLGSVNVTQASTGTQITADTNAVNSGELTYTF